MLVPIIGMLLFALLLNFTITRPQRIKHDRHALMVASVKKGSIIYAGGGIRCSVLDVSQDTMTVQTAPSKTRLEFDVDALEDVEGFDYKKEKALQKRLRKERISHRS